MDSSLGDFSNFRFTTGGRHLIGWGKIADQSEPTCHHNVSTFRFQTIFFCLCYAIQSVRPRCDCLFWNIFLWRKMKKSEKRSVNIKKGRFKRQFTRPINRKRLIDHIELSEQWLKRSYCKEITGNMRKSSSKIESLYCLLSGRRRQRKTSCLAFKVVSYKPVVVSYKPVWMTPGTTTGCLPCAVV